MRTPVCVELLNNTIKVKTFALTFYVHYYNISYVDWKIVNIIS
jgi:hypothetical protein